ncbi:hypothetical protein FACS189451_09980 [Bacteroidia bacterium]|nr:hypothetical protein FACS189451_09980 [Bacteroidia bacterium]
MESQSFAQYKRFNYGFRVGLNALSTTEYQTFYAGEPTSGGFYTNKIGYVAAGFFRINYYSKFFLQPEIAWSFHQQDCSFGIPSASNSETYFTENLDINMNRLNANVLLGYNLIKNKPYLCDIYAGASLKWTYRMKYDISKELRYTEKSDFSCYAGIIGFSVNISTLYFDFRYEINQPNTNLEFSDVPDIPDKYKGVFLEKNENILSFSVGMMF